MGELLFLYDFEFVAYENPPHTIDGFAEALRSYVKEHGLDYGMSALGGMVHRRGHVHGKDRPVTEEDRRALAAWASAQRVRCTARLGELEQDRDDIEFFRDITDWVFDIDNLTAEDRAEAAAWNERLRQRAESARHRPA